MADGPTLVPIAGLVNEMVVRTIWRTCSDQIRPHGTWNPRPRREYDARARRSSPSTLHRVGGANYLLANSEAPFGPIFSDPLHIEATGIALARSTEYRSHQAGFPVHPRSPRLRPGCHCRPASRRTLPASHGRSSPHHCAVLENQSQARSQAGESCHAHRTARRRYDLLIVEQRHETRQRPGPASS